MPYKRVYGNQRGDSSKIVYKYSKKGVLKKRIDWEYERRTKRRKGAPKYGYSTGCVVINEKDVVRYRKWVIHQKKSYHFRQGKLVKLRTPYDYEDEGCSWEMSYDTSGRLIEKKEFSYKKRHVNWVEQVQYFTNKSIVKRKYFAHDSNAIFLEKSFIYNYKNGRLSSYKYASSNPEGSDDTHYYYKNERLIRVKRVSLGRLLFDYKIEYQTN